MTAAPDGAVRLLYTADLPYEGSEHDRRPWLVYAECAAPCAAEADWSAPALVLFLDHGYGEPSFSAATDAAGRLHVAAKPIGQSLVYAWCGGDCADPDAWTGYALGLDAGDGEYPALALDGAGRPRIAHRYADGDYGLGYAWCEGDCQGAAPQWGRALVEDEDALFGAVPVALAPGCDAHEWQGGLRPSLALGPGGHPTVGYDADYSRRCYHDPRRPELGTFVERTFWTSRFVFFPHAGGTPTPAEPAPPAAGPSLGVVSPNPARGTVRVPVALVEAGDARLAVTDALGREVAVLLDGRQPAGAREVAWDVAGLPAGLYVVRLEAGGRSLSQTLTLVR